MDSSRDSELDARLASIEASIAALQQSVATLLEDRKGLGSRPAARGAGERERPNRATSTGSGASEPAGQWTSRAQRNYADEWGADLSSWISSRAPEWWLSRLGIAFVVIAVLFLYGYAIDKGWITPPIRVTAGALLGAGLFWLAARMPRQPQGAARSGDPGLRELFFGGGLAVWYVSAYAAAVWYGLILIPSARLIFFMLAIVSTWIALEEDREIFALLAVVAGFATPFVLPAPARSATELSLYIGLITAIGLAVYLIRGWHSIVWISFVGLWLSIAGVVGGTRSPGHRSIAITILVVLAAAAFVRTPSLRRQLVLLGSARYRPLGVTSGTRRLMEGLDSLADALGGGKSAPDSLIFWVLPLISPILAINALGAGWRTVPNQAWGLIMLGLAALAFVAARRSNTGDGELIHVAATAAALLAVLSIGRIVFTPESIAIAALVATIVMVSAARKYAGARTVAKATIAIALTGIVGHELGFVEVGLMHLRWVLSGIAAIGCAAVIAQALIADGRERQQGIVLAVAAYVTGLVLLWRMLQPVWPPLVTISYALLGGTMLVLSRRPGWSPMLRRPGAITMIVVVGRLLIVDMASVETIWRVLLFLLCGAVFLYTAYRLQPSDAATKRKPG